MNKEENDADTWLKAGLREEQLNRPDSEVGTCLAGLRNQGGQGAPWGGKRAGTECSQEWTGKTEAVVRK